MRLNQHDLEFAEDHRVFIAWLKRAHDLEFRQGLKPRIAWRCQMYRDEFKAALAERGNVVEAEFA
jgi:urocanate hydratase